MISLAIVDVQGFKTEENKFILKELAIVYNDQLQVYLVKPPFSFNNLSATEKKHVKWIERNRRILWNDGHITYEQCIVDVRKFLSYDIDIYCKGSEKVTWINAVLGRSDVKNLEDVHCPNLLSLHEKYKSCNWIYSCTSHPTMCALKNVTCLKKWYLENECL